MAPKGTTHLKTVMFLASSGDDMCRLLSNNVVLVSQQVDAVRATWRVFRLISISLLATGQGSTPP